MSFNGLTLLHCHWQSYRWRSVQAACLACSFWNRDCAFLKQKKRVTIFIIVPDLSGIFRVLPSILTPMKFIMCLMVPEVKVMSC